MKRILIAAVAVVGLGVVGCKSKTEEVRDQRADLVEERQEANQKIADIRAETAQDKADLDAKAADKIADERRELAEERQDLAAAQNDLNKEQRKEEVAAMPAGSVTGTLKNSMGSSLTLRDNEGVEHSFDVKDSTKVTYNGQAVKLDDYKAGTEIRASFVSDGDDKVAKDVVILNPASKEDRDHKKVDDHL